MSIHIYRLTKSGRSVANKVSMSNRNKYLDYLYKQKKGTATDDEMANWFGESKVSVRMAMRRLGRLVEDMTKDNGGV